MSIDSQEDLVGMQRVGEVVANVLDEMAAAVRPGMTTGELDAIGEAALTRHGARSAPQLAYGFPGFTCISVNDETVHGVPGARALEPGDVVKIDVTAELGGYIADSARTVVLQPASAMGRRLRNSAVAALDRALAVARAGEYVSVIGRAVEAQARHDGFSVVRELCGHGVGRKIHEAPTVPNYEDPFSRTRLTEGLVIAVEPMLTARPSRAVDAGDGWTIQTHNRSLAVHEEHTIVITRSTPIVLTARRTQA
jgi:methionyl aminopeptidase